MTPSCNLRALGAYAPETVLTNDDLARLVDTSDEWIVTRTGIRQRRRLADTENASDLGLAAARQALEEAGLDAGDLTHVIAATCSPDALSPSVACVIAGQIGAAGVMAFDIGAACSGFLYGLSVCRALLLQEPAAKILLVCTEALTRRVNWADRATCVLFGDAAAACVLDADSHGTPLARLEDVVCHSDGAQRGLIVVGGGTACRYAEGDSLRADYFISMQGRETYKHAVRNMVRVCGEILERNSLTSADVDLLVPHQANLRIIEAVGGRLELADRVFTNVDKYGNTSSASIPLALAEARAAGRTPRGTRVLTAAFGAGLTWGAALLRF